MSATTTVATISRFSEHGSNWGRLHVTGTAAVSEVRAGGFGVKVEKKVCAIPLGKLREIAFQGFL